MRTVSDAGTVRQRDGLIIDAVVLIDFLESDATLFRLISEHIGNPGVTGGKTGNTARGR
ncbi:MAG: hypothetical protein GX075_03670 [Firmicutes bacterium]|nr:hypothetical protein [Bacillota bacterium]